MCLNERHLIVIKREKVFKLPYHHHQGYLNKTITSKYRISAEIDYLVCACIFNTSECLSEFISNLVTFQETP